MATEVQNAIDAPDAEYNEIAQYVFSRPPSAPKSIVLEMSENSEEFDMPEKAILGMYIDIAILGCTILWGRDTDLLTL